MCLCKVGQNIVNKAASHVGEVEQPLGSNSGEAVNRYLAYVGLDPGNAWCAAFASFVVGNVLAEMGLSDHAHPRTGSSHEIVNWGIAHGRIIPSNQVKPGDLGIVKGGDGEPAQNGETYHHTVVLVDATGNTIEGNFSDKVKRNWRDLSTLTIVRPFI
jgi:hypothetical protein